MTQYNPKSLNADEFINDAEILDTLRYADENKDNIELIDSIIEKAKLRKGIDHREASVLLACDNPEKLKEIYALAEQIKKDFYGERIVMALPLKLLRKRLRLLPVPPQKQAHLPQKAHSGGGQG